MSVPLRGAVLRRRTSPFGDGPPGRGQFLPITYSSFWDASPGRRYIRFAFKADVWALFGTVLPTMVPSRQRSVVGWGSLTGSLW